MWCESVDRAFDLYQYFKLWCVRFSAMLSGTLIFSSYVGSGQASTVHPKKKYQEYQAPPKNIWIFSNPKYTPILYLDNKKIP